MGAIELSVGDRSRHHAGIAILASLAVAAGYAVFTVMTKETPALYLHQPWQDDPFDALVSLDFVVLPLLVVIGVLRVQLCRRYEPLPGRRLVDLLRVAGVAVGLCLATQLAEWVAVALGLHRASWTLVTTGQVAALVVLTAAAMGCGVLLWRARRGLARTAHAAGQPDWLTDTVALGLRAARWLGPFGRLARLAIRWVDEQVLIRVRAHPIGAAAVFAVVLTLPEVAAKIVLERYPAPLVLFVLMVSTASLFAFVVIVGSYLRVVAPRQPRPSVWLCAAVVTCVAGTLTVPFRNSLLWIVGTSDAQLTTATLTGLTLGVGVAAGALSLAGQTALRRGRHLQRGDEPSR